MVQNAKRQTKKVQDRQIATRIPPDWYAALEKQAVANSRSISGELRQLIRAAVVEREVEAA